MLSRCSAYCSQINLTWTGRVLYPIILRAILYSVRGNLPLGSSCAQNDVIQAHELNTNQQCVTLGKKKKKLVLFSGVLTGRPFARPGNYMLLIFLWGIKA